MEALAPRPAILTAAEKSLTAGDSPRQLEVVPPLLGVWTTPCRMQFLLSLLCIKGNKHIPFVLFSSFCEDVGHFLSAGWICLTCSCVEIPTWTAVSDHVWILLGTLERSFVFSFYDATVQFYIHQETPRAVLCCLIITVFLWLRTLAYLHWVSYPSPGVWLWPKSEALGVQILRPPFCLPSSFFGSACNICQWSKSHCSVISVSLVCVPERSRVLTEM